MVNVISKKCVQPGCSKIPSYGIEGTHKAELCVQHTREGMVDVKNRKCAHPGCSTRPHFGIAG